MFMHKCHNDLPIRDTVIEMFTANIVILDHNAIICVNGLRIRYKGVRHIGVQIWNLISDIIRQRNGIHVFKSEFRKYLLRNLYPTI